ncbi:hypothetical protein IQ07DRAFT_681810 [Pyrenochaeta sp. DS3sAY3a]|nr:hypothetical protein IQ07DRAFT_681810 [Pyrenochaeta sp. DS3sAY3a]
MCNTLAYTYTCAHTLSHRRSACAGTKHKPSRSGPKAACLPEPCLTVRLGRVCGACELGVWEEGWRVRLERARGFVEGVRGGGGDGDGTEGGGERGGAGESENFPSTHPSRTPPTPFPAKPTITTTASATRTLSSLLTTLQSTHTTLSWQQHTSLPRRPKSRTPRVPPTVFTRTSSPLRHEVLPQDIVEPAQQKAWSEVRVEEFDWGYVASTDPLHPVCAVYGVPGEGEGEGNGEREDGTAGVWGFEGEGQEVGFEEGSEAGFEEAASAWEWDHRDNEKERESEDLHVRLRGGDAQEQEREGFGQDSGEDGLEAWSGDELGKTSGAQCSDADLGNCEDMDADVEEIVKAFWAVVNEGFEPEMYGVERIG